MKVNKRNFSKLDLIAKRIDDLFKLPQQHDVILISNIRKEFRPDLQQFIIGETMYMESGKLVIGKNLYEKWLKKIKAEGFDEDIHF